MTVSISPLPIQRFFDNANVPLVGGKLFTYGAGTNTKVATYTDSTGGTPNANPVILNSRGECSLFLTTSQSYKLVLAPSTDTDPPTNPFWTQDNVVAPLGSGANPTFSGQVTASGGIVDGSGNTYMPIVSRVKASQTSRVSTTTLVNDPDLVAALSTGTWYFRFMVPIWCTTSSTGQCEIQVAFSGTATGYWTTVSSAGPSAGVGSLTAVGTPASPFVPPVAGFIGGAYGVVMEGFAIVTVAGSLSLQWAQSVSNANALNFGIGGTMVCTKVA